MVEKRKVTKKHLPPDREVMILSIGEEVVVGKEDSSNPNWKNWIWCISNSGLSGWVPKQFLSINGNSGKLIKEYTSLELPVVAGDELTVNYYLNGWGWCSDSSGTQGWVPEENL